jgi:hypothetical protein
MILTILEFRRRFTNEEKVMIDLASIDNPSLDMQSRAAIAALRVYLQDLSSASFVDTNDPATVGGINTLAAFGLIQSSRVAEILADTTLSNTSESVNLLTDQVVFADGNYRVKTGGTYMKSSLVPCYHYLDGDKIPNISYLPEQILEGN